MISNIHNTLAWDVIDLDIILLQSPATRRAFGDAIDDARQGVLSEQETNMTVEEWIRCNAIKAEDSLKVECERMVSKFEQEGLKALKVLESIKCTD